MRVQTTSLGHYTLLTVQKVLTSCHVWIADAISHDKRVNKSFRFPRSEVAQQEFTSGQLHLLVVINFYYTPSKPCLITLGHYALLTVQHRLPRSEFAQQEFYIRLRAVTRSLQL